MYSKPALIKCKKKIIIIIIKKNTQKKKSFRLSQVYNKILFSNSHSTTSCKNNSSDYIRQHHYLCIAVTLQLRITQLLRLLQWVELVCEILQPAITGIHIICFLLIIKKICEFVWVVILIEALPSEWPAFNLESWGCQLCKSKSANWLSDWVHEHFK